MPVHIPIKKLRSESMKFLPIFVICKKMRMDVLSYEETYFKRLVFKVFDFWRFFEFEELFYLGIQKTKKYM